MLGAGCDAGPARKRCKLIGKTRSVERSIPDPSLEQPKPKRWRRLCLLTPQDWFENPLWSIVRRDLFMVSGSAVLAPREGHAVAGCERYADQLVRPAGLWEFSPGRLHV